MSSSDSTVAAATAAGPNDVPSSSSLSTPSFTPASITWHNVNVWARPSVSVLDTITFKSQPHGSQIIKNGKSINLFGLFVKKSLFYLCNNYSFWKS